MSQKKHIEIDISKQTLLFFEGDELISEYIISTAKNGPGELMDSECTPRGKHIISEKIGAGCEVNTIFVGRDPTGEFITFKKQECLSADINFYVFFMTHICSSYVYSEAYCCLTVSRPS